MKGDALHWLAGASNRYLAVPTNLGVRKDHRAIMGAGLARQVRDHFEAEQIDVEYGRALLAARAQVASRPGDTRWHGQLFVMQGAPLIMLPTKIDWQRPAVPELIDANLQALAEWIKDHPGVHVGVPLLGAGLGGLEADASARMITRRLDGLAFTLIEPPQPGVFESDVPDTLRAYLSGRKALVVTGHRPDKLGGYSPQVRQHTREVTETILRDHRPDVLIHGAALGVDSAFADAAESLGIPTIQVEPCLEHPSRWRGEDIERHRRQGAYAKATGARVIVHEQTYDQLGPKCMQDRNAYMLDLLALARPESRLVTIWDGSSGGTRNCLLALRDKGLQDRYGGNYYRRFLQRHPIQDAMPSPPSRAA